MSIRVLVNGAFGRMGVVTQAAIQAAEGLELVATTGRQDNLADAIENSGAEVVVDFTLPEAVFNNVQTILKAGARAVVGTSGLKPEQIKMLGATCQQQKLGCIIAPNFSVGAILMMRFAAEAAKYFPNAEIIEMHHEKKIDAPSGTAVKTAQMMAATRSPDGLIIDHSASARGAVYDEIPIHSVRLPGLFAHQQVLFGGFGETLTIKHDSMDRSSMMPGVCLACHEVMNLDRLVYGLEHILHD